MNINIPANLLELLPIEEALSVLKFDERSQFGNPQRHWGVIEVIAGPWIGNWLLIVSIHRNTERTIYLPQERYLGLKMCPIDILAIIYNASRTLFRTEEPPIELLWGKLHQDQEWDKMQQEEEKRPKLWAEREFFRYCMSYLAKFNDWSEEDYEIEFSYADGQLKIRARNMEVFCPARGTFYGTLTFSARQLFRNIPKRFIDSTVYIVVWPENKVVIGSRGLSAKWTESQPTQLDS